MESKNMESSTSRDKSDFLTDQEIKRLEARENLWISVKGAQIALDKVEKALVDDALEEGKYRALIRAVQEQIPTREWSE